MFKTRVAPALVLLSAALGLIPTVPVRADVIGSGELKLDINAYGVVTGVQSRAVKTVDGPRMDFTPASCVEWAGVMFEESTGMTSVVAPGAVADWAQRPEIEKVSADYGPDWARIVTRAGHMEVAHYYRFEDWGSPLLVCTTTLSNQGPEKIRNIMYTRESEVRGKGWSFPYDLGDMAGKAPDGIVRRLWMANDIAPGDFESFTFSYALAAGDLLPLASDVPLVWWKGPGFESGLVYGDTAGISWGDYDHDGFIDVFACYGRKLWRNKGGTNWEHVATLSMPGSYRYGSSFGDYNLDNLPDIATEPRAFADNFMHLFKNLGGGPNFVDVAGDTAIIDVRPFGDSETICWADVDGDTHMDCFVPVYPPDGYGGPGNFFLHSLGPTGPGGEYRFKEMVDAAGLDNPVDTDRPEGAQWEDTDQDGDLDLYANGVHYQNISTTGVPKFNAQTQAASGIGFRSSLDEGAMFCDYDMDGDYDVLVVYSGPGVKIWDNFGDGMYKETDTVIDSPRTGLDLGMSAEDWDMDGDVDFTTRQVFRRNQLMETGTRHFTVATTDIPGGHLTSATPAWGDWDKDGDLDCALGNWFELGRFYENTKWTPATPLADRRSIRVRPVRQSAITSYGLEAEYGANVEVQIAGDAPGRRRMKFSASGSGYLNQNEYALTFAMPADPKPEDPTEDVRFDLTIDFPRLGGIYRVDKHVNPAVGNLNLADLTQREIVVFRSGAVRVNGVDFPPPRDESPELTTAAGGLALPGATTGLPAPSAGGPTTYVGLDLDTLDATAPQRIREIIVDGQVGGLFSCGEPGRLILWDVTDATPVRVASINALPEPRNRRQFIKTDLLLQPGRHYRLVSTAFSYRPTTVSGPIDEGAVTVRGGLFYTDSEPCSGSAAEGAALDPSRVYLTVRYAEVGCGPDCNADRVLNVNDFICFQSRWRTRAAYGDYNGDGSYNINDFIAFQSAWARGCGG